MINGTKQAKEIPTSHRLSLLLEMKMADEWLHWNTGDNFNRVLSLSPSSFSIVHSYKFNIEAGRGDNKMWLLLPLQTETQETQNGALIFVLVRLGATRRRELCSALLHCYWHCHWQQQWQASVWIRGLPYGVQFKQADNPLRFVWGCEETCERETWNECMCVCVCGRVCLCMCICAYTQTRTVWLFHPHLQFPCPLQCLCVHEHERMHASKIFVC